MKMISTKLIWPTVAISSVLLLELCFAYPMDKIVVEDSSDDATDMEVAESEKAPVLVFPVKNSEYYVDGFTDNIEPEETTNDAVVANPGDKSENDDDEDDGDDENTSDADHAESSNAAAVVVKPENKSRNNEGYINFDIEAAESSNAPVAAADDFNLHSQAEANGSKPGFRISLLQPPVKSRESVNLEAEAPPSKILSYYDNSQKVIVDKTQPLPIVDTISEHEKYGNNGDMFDGISRSLVNGYEAFSNLLNSIIQKPREIFRNINKSVNAQLDMIGGKLVGL